MLLHKLFLNDSARVSGRFHHRRRIIAVPHGGLESAIRRIFSIRALSTVSQRTFVASCPKLSPETELVNRRDAADRLASIAREVYHAAGYGDRTDRQG